MSRDCRVVAAQTLATITADGRALNAVFPPALPRVAERDRGLLRELVYGSLRYYWQLAGLLDQLLDKPLKAKDADVHALLMIGLYQLLHTRIPDHAAVSSVVNATKGLGKGWARGLLNGVLRQFQRRRDELLASLSEPAALAHPDWLLNTLREQWPDDWQDIIAANNGAPPMCLRSNARRGSRDDYAARLAETGIDASPGQYAPQSLRLAQAQDVDTLPGFRDGLASVQDEAAQMAAVLLDAQSADHVLDACAAPGGKACHIAELQPQLASLTALELDEQRLQRIEENRARLRLSLELVAGDASQPPASVRERQYQRILIDAPCSATGVIRRNPDVKLLRRSDDALGFATTQRAILAGLWPLLAPGGRLLYATCSVLYDENDGVIDEFLAHHADAVVETVYCPGAEQTKHGWQYLPSVHGPDGLYYAALTRSA